MKIAKLSSMSLISRGMHVFLILFIAAVLFACGDKSDLTSHIPKDANGVVTVDVKSMALKSVSFKQIFNLDNLKKVVGGGGEKSDSAATSIADSGIDLMSKVYIFGQASEAGKYGAMAAPLSDSKKFEEFLKNSDKSLTVTEDGGLKFATVGNEKVIITWNKDAVYVVFGEDKIKETAILIANLKKEESLPASNDSFKASQKDAADISLWLSFDQLTKLASQYGASNLNGVSFKDTYLTATCNFEDGQIVANAKYTLTPETAEKYNFVKASVNSDVISTVPGETLIGFAGLAFDMEKIYNHLEKENLVSAYGPMATQMTGLTAKDLLTMLSGDMAFSINGIEVKEVMGLDAMGQPSMRKQTQPDYSVVFGVASKDKVKQLLEQLTKNGMLTKVGTYYTFQNKVFIFEKGSTLIVTGSEARQKAIEAGSGAKLDAELSTMLSSNSSTLYVNLVNIPDNAYGDSGEMATKVKQTEVQSVEITSAAMKDNMSTSKLVIKFKEKNENALVTLGRISKNFENYMKQQPAVTDAVIDSTATVVAPNQ